MAKVRKVVAWSKSWLIIAGEKVNKEVYIGIEGSCNVTFGSKINFYNLGILLPPFYSTDI